MYRVWHLTLRSPSHLIPCPSTQKGTEPKHYYCVKTFLRLIHHDRNRLQGKETLREVAEKEKETMPESCYFYLLLIEDLMKGEF